MSAPRLDALFDGLIATPSMSSVNPQFDVGNLAVSELFAGWLDALGFRVELLPLPGAPDKCNIVATLGNGPGGLVLAGHTDTVPYDEGRWSHDPFVATRESGRLYGLGSTDMKGFFALVIEAVRGMDVTALRAPLIVLATADEESGMAGARALAATRSIDARHAVIGEPTGLRPVRLHKGIFMEAIRLTGRSGHSSDPALGRNALDGMHRVIGELLALRTELAAHWPHAAFDVPHPTLNLGHIRGGDNPNRICAQCELHIDVRLVPGMRVGETRALVRERARNAVDGLGLEVEFEALFDGIDPLETPAHADIVRSCEALTGQESASVAFATEGPVFERMGLQSVVLGPGDIAVAHQPDEYLDLGMIEPTVSLIKRLVHAHCIAT